MTWRDIRIFGFGAAVAATAVAIAFSYCGSPPPEPERPPWRAETVPDNEVDAVDAGKPAITQALAPAIPAAQTPSPRGSATFVMRDPDAGAAREDAAVGDGDTPPPPPTPPVELEASQYRYDHLLGAKSGAVWGVALDRGAAIISDTAGALVGRVRFRGEAPKALELAYGGDKFGREHLKPRPTMAVNDYGFLGDAVVRITWGMDPKPAPEQAVEIEIRDCSLSPPVVGAVLQQVVRLTNRDPVSHPIRLHISNSEMSEKPLGPDESRDFRFSSLGPSGLRRYFGSEARILVVPHPYYSVTDRYGEFVIPLVPPGTYTVTAWHPLLGAKDQLVSVHAGHETMINFFFSQSDLR